MQKILITLFICLIVLLYDIRYTFASEQFVPYPRGSEIQEIPVTCTSAELLDKHLQSGKWIPSKTYNGRQAALKDAPVVFVLIEYRNIKHPKETIVTLTVPSGESCVMYHVFDEKTVK